MDIPVQYRPSLSDLPATFRIDDGRLLTARLIRPDDEAGLIHLFRRLSSETRRRRFHENVDHVSLDRVHFTAHQLANVDNRTSGGAVLALTAEPVDSFPSDLAETCRQPCSKGSAAAMCDAIVGVARLARPTQQPMAPDAEVAVVVRDDFQNLGVGKELLRRLLLLARQMGIEILVAQVEAYNEVALRLFRDLDLPKTTRTSQGETEIRITVPYPSGMGFSDSHLGRDKVGRRD